MASCPNCESAVDREDKYCRACGAELETPGERHSFPPEASPMFGGEKWSASPGSQWGPSSDGTEPESNDSTDGTPEDQSTRAMTYPPESSPMFGGETWTMPGSDDSSAGETQSTGTSDSRTRDAIRNMLIYAAATIAIITVWYLFM